MKLNKRHTCPVCGYDGLSEQPWEFEGNASFEICPSCGIQFGYDDAAGGDQDKRGAVWKRWRDQWIKNGMHWSSIGVLPPPDWNPALQLGNIMKLGS